MTSAPRAVCSLLLGSMWAAADARFRAYDRLLDRCGRTCYCRGVDDELLVTESLAVVVGAVSRGEPRPGREITLTGPVICRAEFPEALRLVAEGAVRTRPLVTHRFALEAAFAAHQEPTAIKVAVTIP